MAPAGAEQLEGGEETGDVGVLALGQLRQRGRRLPVRLEHQVQPRQRARVLQRPLRAGLGGIAQLGELVRQRQPRRGGVKPPLGDLYQRGGRGGLGGEELGDGGHGGPFGGKW